MSRAVFGKVGVDKGWSLVWPAKKQPWFFGGFVLSNGLTI